MTGAAMGMGLASARNGAAVVLVDLDGELAVRCTEEIVGHGGNANGFACDVTDEWQVAVLVDRTIAQYGRLDIAFNAGI